MNDFTDLNLVRVIDPALIPEDLIDQIQTRSFTVPEFYSINKDDGVLFDGESFILNPLNHLYAIVDPEKKIKGVLWCTIDRQECNINIFSIKREYWKKGNVFGSILEKMNEIFIPVGIKKYKIITSHPRCYDKSGFKRSNKIIMELEVE